MVMTRAWRDGTAVERDFPVDRVSDLVERDDGTFVWVDHTDPRPGDLAQLEDELGRPCRFLAYPFGHEDARVRAAARRAGYEAAFALPGDVAAPDDFAVPRLGVWRRDTLPRLSKT